VIPLRRPRTPGFLLVALGLVLTAAGADGAPMSPTQPTHTGPWYQPGAPETRDLWSPGMPGERLTLRGRVLDTAARAVQGALVEFWHTDAAGSYPPLRGSVRSGRDGGFVIRTVLPGHNQGYRARHVHFVITRDAAPPLVTRIYFRGDTNIDEAPWPELAITLEEANVDGQRRFLGSIEFVLPANAGD
jgi:protocatechuate 3,4-dioxygenase beta subunit